MRFAVLLALLAGCGAVTTAAGDAGLAGPDAGGKSDLDLGGRDACPPTALDCTGIVRSACPQGQALAAKRVCGGAPVAVCCPSSICELEACAPCPDCAS